MLAVDQCLAAASIVLSLVWEAVSERYLGGPELCPVFSGTRLEQ